MARRRTRVELDLGDLPLRFARLRANLGAHLEVLVKKVATPIMLGAITRFAPQPGEERDILVQGTIVEPWTRRFGRAFSRRSFDAITRPSSTGEMKYRKKIGGAGGGLVGSDADGRFIKRGANEKFIVEALHEQKWKRTSISVLKTMVKIKMKWGSWRMMANRTQFSYFRRMNRGGKSANWIKKTTKPFNEDWPRTAEKGGTWTVVPRDDRAGAFQPPLNPQEGVYARRMLKMVKPFRYAEKTQRIVNAWFVNQGAQRAFNTAAAAAGFDTVGVTG